MSKPPIDTLPNEIDAEATQISAPPSARPMAPPAARPMPASRPMPSSRPLPESRPQPLPPSQAAQPSPAQPYAASPQFAPPQPAPPQFATPPTAPAMSPHKMVPPTPRPSGPPPSAFASPEAPAALPPRAGFAPEGIIQKAASPDGGFKKTFTGTIMGTMVFIAKSRSVGLSAKIGGVILVVGAIAVSAVLWMQKQSRDQAQRDLTAAMALPDGEGVPRVRGLIGAGLDDDATAAALRFLGTHRDAESVPLFIEGLAGGPAVQRAAADGLAEVGPPAAAPAAGALAELLDSEDQTLRMHAAWALARLEDARGLDEVIAAIAEGSAPSLSSYDPHALARLMDREGLLAALTHDSGTVRQFAARHLGDVCTAADEPALTRAAGDDDAGVVEAAIVSLARCGMASASERIAATFASGHERWNPLYAHMRGDAGVRGMGLLLPYAPNDDTRRVLMQEIALSFDPAAGDVLLAELDRVEAPSARDRLDVGLALAFASHPRLVEVLEPLIGGGEVDHAQAAIALLGQTTNPEHVEERLLALLRDATLRGSAVDAMAEAGVCSDAAQTALSRVQNQRGMRAKALRALGRCGHERALSQARAEVSEPLSSPVTVEAGELRLAALDVVGAAAMEDLAPALFEQLSDPATDTRVRTAIADVLAVLAPDAVRDQVLDRLFDPQRPAAVRHAMLRVLTAGVAPSSVPRLLGFVRGGEDDARTRNAAVLLGLSHHGASRDELVTLLTDERASRQAALALALGADRASAVPLARRVRADEALSTHVAEALRTPPWSFPRAHQTRLAAHIRSVMAVRDAGYPAPASRLCEALAAPPAGLLLHTQSSLARALHHDLTEGEAPATRLMAAEALACMGARSAVLSVRDARGVGADEARLALADVRTDAPAPTP